MMLGKKKLLLLVMLMGVIWADLQAQIIDYRSEESPIISWNGVPLHDARLLALAGISSLASESFAKAINPAMGTESRKVAMAFTLNGLHYDSFQYWGINQGVIIEPEGLSEQKILVSGVAMTWPWKTLSVSAGWHICSLHEFPSFEFIEQYDGESWIYEGEFKGKLNTCFLALSRKFGKKFSLGIKFDYIFGTRESDIKDLYHFIYMNIPDFNRITFRETHRLSQFGLSIGASWQLIDTWLFNMVLVIPFTGKANRSIVREFYSSLTEERLTISSQDGKNDFHRPTKIHFSTSRDFPVGKNSRYGKLTVATEMVYSIWSDYRYDYFDETLPRDMKNTLALALGIEYGIPGKTREIFLRAGYRFDPQPLEQIPTTLNALSGGVGIKLGKLNWDLGFSYYFCFVEGYSQNHLVVSSTVNIPLKGGQ
jgi:hypothetical protein